MSERVREDMLPLQRTPAMPLGFNAEELVFLAEQRSAEMFVTVTTYKAKAGEEDAIIALHEAWQRHQQPHVRGYLSGELLRNVKDSREFIAIMRFETQEAAQALTNDPEREAWYQRVVSLTENVPTLTEYTSEWP
jgi:antibiotic biosynthesis monooxygenase (ABM) superfamily enzyme